MSKIILETYVSKHEPPPDNTRPSFKLKEVNAISKSRRERLLNLLNELKDNEMAKQTIKNIEELEKKDT